MKDDPIVGEIRRGRREHAEKFKFDLDAIARDVRSREGADGEQVLTLPPKTRTSTK